MKTAEEILKHVKDTLYDGVYKNTSMGGVEYLIALKAMQEYSDQENERLLKIVEIQNKMLAAYRVTPFAAESAHFRELETELAKSQIMTPLELLHQELDKYQMALKKSTESYKEGKIDHATNSLHKSNLDIKIQQYKKAIKILFSSIV